MKPKITFQEMARLGIELLKKQPPVTLDEAKAQSEWLRKSSTTPKNKRKRAK